MARAAKGSLRDSLSLTDQAIAQTNGDIRLGAVREMLGFLEQSWAEILLQDVLNRDLSGMQAHIQQLVSSHSHFQAVLDDMLSLLHLAALSQYQLSASELALTESAFVRAVAKTHAPESIQLYYQLLLSGKELLARACHLASPRGQSPLMALNCAGLPESMAETELFGYGPGAFEGARPEGKLGLLELTAGGTLFLDGVGEMSPRLQAKLLRFLQDGCFRRVGSDEEVYLDVRVICATQVDLSELCAKGEFRQDLYHRLNVLSLHIPPLRECLDGLPPLVEHFLDQASRQIGCPLPKLAPQVLDKLSHYHWPGNVRQLENVLFQAVSLCDGGVVKGEHIRLPDYGAPQPLGEFSVEGGLDEILGRFEKAVLERLFHDHPSSRQLGKRLGVSHTTIANKLRQHGLGKE